MKHANFRRLLPFSSATRLLRCERLLVAPPEEGVREQSGNYEAAVCSG